MYGESHLRYARREIAVCADIGADHRRDVIAAVRCTRDFRCSA